jgi:hypothetical protein
MSPHRDGPGLGIGMMFSYYFGPFIIDENAVRAAEEQRVVNDYYTAHLPPANTPEHKVTAQQLTAQGRTFRERAFARCFAGFLYNDGNLNIRLKRGLAWGDFPIKPRNLNVKWIMGAVSSNKEARHFLTKLNIVAALYAKGCDPEVTVVLQDLADAVSHEGTNAFKADYYPGIPEIFVPDEHIDVVMEAMQREVDREAHRVGMKPAKYSTLPRERQRALAERRRWWFAKFGITPESWKRGTFNIWNIANESIASYEEWIKFNTHIV